MGVFQCVCLCVNNLLHLISFWEKTFFPLLYYLLGECLQPLTKCIFMHIISPGLISGLFWVLIIVLNPHWGGRWAGSIPFNLSHHAMWSRMACPHNKLLCSCLSQYLPSMAQEGSQGVRKFNAVTHVFIPWSVHAGQETRNSGQQEGPSNQVGIEEKCVFLGQIPQCWLWLQWLIHERSHLGIP